jgi:hypothetical protein
VNVAFNWFEEADHSPVHQNRYFVAEKLPFSVYKT